MSKFGMPFFSALFGALFLAILVALQPDNAGDYVDTTELIAALERRVSSLETRLVKDDLPLPGGMSDSEKVSLFEAAGLEATAIATILTNEKEIQQLFVIAERRRQDPREQIQDKLRELQLMIGDDAYTVYFEATGREPYISVQSVTSGSIAQRSGLIAGDRITHYAGERVFTPLDLERVAGDLSGTARTKLKVERAGATLQIEVETGQLGATALGGYPF